MEEYLALAKEAARAAGAIQLEKRGRVQSIQFKGEINLVTEVDHACEQTIIDILHQAYPEHQILAEEAGLQESSSEFKWIIDYAHGYPCYCVSIALEHQGTVKLGVVYDATRDEMFEVIRGHGALLNGQAIHVSDNRELKRSLLATGFAYDVQEVKNNNLDHFSAFILNSQAVRRDGAAAIDLAYVACGRYDGFWELNLWPWDVAVGALLVEEAGGRLSRLDGSPADIYCREIVASNGIIHQEMIATLQKHPHSATKVKTSS